MTPMARLACTAALIAAAALPLARAGAQDSTPPPEAAADTPGFAVDPFWPRPLPNDWIMGQVAGVHVDADDRVWIVQRPRSLTERELGASQEPPLSNCCFAAPPVLEFDLSGNLLRAWGGPGDGYDWPRNEHGIHVAEGFVWLAGNGEGDNQILKFTTDGEFVMQVGAADRNTGSNDTENLGRPADLFVDTTAREVYVADGYGNRRVVVFDADTGAYKRHWGAYGNRPHDDPMPAYDPAREPSDQFSSPVHCVYVSTDRLVYACDRANNRYQVFETDGTFVSEAFFERGTLLSGSVSGPRAVERRRADLDFHGRWHEQRDQGRRTDVRRYAGAVRPGGPLRRPVPRCARHRDRFAGQSLHDRGQHRAARPEVPKARSVAGRILPG